MYRAIEISGAATGPAGRAGTGRIPHGLAPMVRRTALAVVTAFGLVTAEAAGVGGDAGAGPFDWPQHGAPIVQLDNDLFAISNGDRDYTGGISISMPLLDHAGIWTPQRWLGPLAQRREDDRVLRTAQFQVLAFTPGVLEQPGVQVLDRPYASLWALTGARQRVTADGRESTFAALTIGALGLRATEVVHRAVHRASGTDLPEGYGHQISAGGEPTAKLTVAKRLLLAGGDIGPGSDAWFTTAGSVGYLSEISIGLTTRLGDRGTPWWSSGADLADYAATPDFGIASLGGERTVEVGVRVTARAYNAFLQGQFRHSDHRFDSSAVEPIVARAWIAVTFATLSGTRFYYRLTAQSAELRDGPASRAHYWGSLGILRTF